MRDYNLSFTDVIKRLLDHDSWTVKCLYEDASMEVIENTLGEFYFTNCGGMMSLRVHPITQVYTVGILEWAIIGPLAYWNTLTVKRRLKNRPLT